MVTYGHVWSHMVPFGSVWSHFDPYGPLWSCVVPYGLVCSCIVCSRMLTFGLVWSRMVPHDPLMSCKDPYGPVWLTNLYFVQSYAPMHKFCACFDLNTSFDTHISMIVDNGFIQPLYFWPALYMIYEYAHQEPAPCGGMVPPVLILQTSPLCNIFTKIPIFFRTLCQPSHKGLIFGQLLV